MLGNTSSGRWGINQGGLPPFRQSHPRSSIPYFSAKNSCKLDSLASVKQSWTDAAHSSPDRFPNAMAKASAAKARFTELQTMLKMKPAA